MASTNTNIIKKSIITAILITIGLISYVKLSEHFSNPETYLNIFAYIDKKKTVVTELAASSTAVSTAITLLPGDTGTSIATAIAGLSSKFLTILIALYLEKYLLTTIGLIVFKFIIPIGLVLLILYVWFKRKVYIDLGSKIIVCGILLMLMIPSGVWTSQKIEETYSYTIQENISKATTEAEEIIKETDSENETNNEKTVTDTRESNSILDILNNLLNSIKGIATNITQIASSLTSNVINYIENIPEKIGNLLNSFIEAVAVLMITSCVIPILVVVLFLYIIKIMFGLNIDIDRYGKNLENQMAKLIATIENKEKE